MKMVNGKQDLEREKRCAYCGDGGSAPKMFCLTCHVYCCYKKSHDGPKYVACSTGRTDSDGNLVHNYSLFTCFDKFHEEGRSKNLPAHGNRNNEL